MHEDVGIIEIRPENREQRAKKKEKRIKNQDRKALTRNIH
ncbi:hypothetical protein SAMN05444483_12027 [Salegentibacter echinorum]|uniref:Uncharacterized protein n=1 Tax=Salegentibacter echinorum TaxID=1073325 RepID=A0A1M5LIT0_SALEC|nr:hypothetical protein SAMN05444483_12027 [Salegentibacter echinorum]